MRQTIISIVVFILTACSSVFVIKPSGHLKGSVTFYFYQAPEGVKKIQIKLTEFIIQEEVAISEWRTVWEVVGSEEVDMIIYGSLVNGFRQQTAAIPLNLHSKYRAVAREQSLIGPPGYAVVYFVFDSSGKVLEANP